MDTERPDDRLTRDQAAKILGWTLRTLDRKIPPGTPGRTTRTPTVDKPDGVLIERRLIMSHLPTPGGDDD